MFFQDGINGINEKINKNHPILPFQYYVNCKSDELIGHMRKIDQDDNWRGCGTKNDNIRTMSELKNLIGIEKTKKYYGRCNNFSI